LPTRWAACHLQSAAASAGIGGSMPAGSTAATHCRPEQLARHKNSDRALTRTSFIDLSTWLNILDILDIFSFCPLAVPNSRPRGCLRISRDRRARPHADDRLHAGEPNGASHRFGVTFAELGRNALAFSEGIDRTEQHVDPVDGSLPVANAPAAGWLLSGHTVAIVQCRSPYGSAFLRMPFAPLGARPDSVWTA
jgi:hypothetical protein